MRTTRIIAEEQLIDHLDSKYLFHHQEVVYHHKLQPIEIRQLLELAFKAVPQLHHAQVWASCGEHAAGSIESMKLVGFTIVKSFDQWLHKFLAAFVVHNLQNGDTIANFALLSKTKSCVCLDISSFSILEYPLAHYAQLASLSVCFAICVRGTTHLLNKDELFVFEFFPQVQSKDPEHIWSVLRLIVKVMWSTLKGFQIADGRQFDGP